MTINERRQNDWYCGMIICIGTWITFLWCRGQIKEALAFFTCNGSKTKIVMTQCRILEIGVTVQQYYGKLCIKRNVSSKGQVEQVLIQGSEKGILTIVLEPSEIVLLTKAETLQSCIAAADIKLWLGVRMFLPRIVTQASLLNRLRSRLLQISYEEEVGLW